MFQASCSLALKAQLSTFKAGYKLILKLTRSQAFKEQGLGWQA
jgi:hypothetical protein